MPDGLPTSSLHSINSTTAALGVGDGKKLVAYALNAGAYITSETFDTSLGIAASSEGVCNQDPRL